MRAGECNSSAISAARITLAQYRSTEKPAQVDWIACSRIGKDDVRVVTKKETSKARA